MVKQTKAFCRFLAREVRLPRMLGNTKSERKRGKRGKKAEEKSGPVYSQYPDKCERVVVKTSHRLSLKGAAPRRAMPHIARS